MQGKIYISTEILEKVFILTPVWVLGMFVLGLLPGFLWWLLTGNALTAKTIILFTLPGSIFLLLAMAGVLFSLAPFWPYRKEGPPVWEQWGYLLVSGFFWTYNVFLILMVLRSNLLLAARVGTGCFIMNLWIGRVIQKRIVIIERSDHVNDPGRNS